MAAPPLGSAEEVALASAAIRLQARARGMAARRRLRGRVHGVQAAGHLQEAGSRCGRSSTMHMPSRQRGRPSIDQQLQAAARAQEAAAASGGAAAAADE